MNYRKVLVILGILLLLPFTLKLKGADFGQNQSLFTDIKAHKVGDILTVNIFEQSRATSLVESTTEKQSKISTKGGPGIGPLGFIPLFGASGENKTAFDGSSEELRNGSLRAKMSVTVLAVKSNGDLIVEGSRTIGLSRGLETLHLTGVVRQKDIAPNNTIDSYLIADAEIHYSGKGDGSAASRPGLVTRFFNWLF